jgi:hypothetical protein
MAVFEGQPVCPNICTILYNIPMERMSKNREQYLLRMASRRVEIGTQDTCRMRFHSF